MESKYVATMDFTSLDNLKAFIKLINENSESVFMNEVRPDLSAMLDHPILVPGIKAENGFIAEIKIFASTPIDLERAKEALNYGIGEMVQKSPSSSLLESVSNFKGFVSRTK